MTTKHSILGASSATRWITCPGSIRLIDALPSGLAERTSRAASEGTAAHELASSCLVHRQPADRWLGLKIEVKDWPEPFEVDQDMADAVQVYLDFVGDELARLGEETEQWTETSVRPFTDRDDMWGTTDCILLQTFGELVVIDYKHGKGVVVDPEFNDQMMFYGLGALRELGTLAADVTKVTLVIVQPRAPHPDGPVRKWETTAAELLEFGETLRLAADRTREPAAPLSAGDHCKFCPAKGACPALKADALGYFDIPVVAPESAEPPAVPVHDPVEIARLLKIIPRWDEFVKGVQGVAMRLAERGTPPPGWKLARKRANRCWVSEEDVRVTLLSRDDLTEGDIYAPAKLKTPAQMEKVKTVGKGWVKEYAIKPEGGLTLVPEDDPRKAVTVAPPVGLLPDAEDWLK